MIQCIALMSVIVPVFSYLVDYFTFYFTLNNCHICQNAWVIFLTIVLWPRFQLEQPRFNDLPPGMRAHHSFSSIPRGSNNGSSRPPAWSRESLFKMKLTDDIFHTFHYASERNLRKKSPSWLIEITQMILWEGNIYENASSNDLGMHR